MQRAPDFLDRSPAARRAQKFPLAASRRIALSSSASASSRFSRARWGHFAEVPELNTTRFTRRQREARRKEVAHV